MKQLFIFCKVGRQAVLEKISLAYSTFTLMKDSLMTTEEIMFLYGEFRTKVPIMHSATALMVSAPSHHVDSTDSFHRFFMYEQNKETDEGHDEDKSSDRDNYDNTLLISKGLH